MKQEMEKEWNNEHGMNRRGFLRQAVLAGSTFCVASTTGKAGGSEPAVMNISGGPDTGLAGMAAVHNRRTLGSGTAAMNVSAMGFGCMGLNHHRSQHPGKEQSIALVREAIERGVTLFVYQHRIDPNTPVEVVADTVKELIREGKVLHFGLCEVNAGTIRRAHAVCPVTAIQSEYHFMHRDVEKNILPVCEELGIGFVPYSPLNRGFLGGMINEYTRFEAANDNRQTLPRFQPDAIRANMRIVEVLNAFGRTKGITPAQVALAWLMNKKPFVVPIPGTTKLSHLEENLRAAEFRFTDSEMKELEEAVAAIPVIGSRYDALQESKVQK